MCVCSADSWMIPVHVYDMMIPYDDAIHSLQNVCRRRPLMNVTIVLRAFRVLSCGCGRQARRVYVGDIVKKMTRSSVTAYGLQA